MLCQIHAFIYLSFHQTFWENTFTKQPFSLGFCDCVVPYWDFDHLSHLPSSFDRSSGAFYMHWDFFSDRELCSFVFFFEHYYQESYFCLPHNLINAGWYKIRRKQTSTEGSGWIHQDSSSFISENHSYFFQGNS